MADPPGFTRTHEPFCANFSFSIQVKQITIQMKIIILNINTYFAQTHSADKRGTLDPIIECTLSANTDARLSALRLTPTVCFQQNQTADKLKLDKNKVCKRLDDESAS